MKKILITGINGFLGQHVARYYIRNNFDVEGIDINDGCQYIQLRKGLKKFYKADMTLDWLKSNIKNMPDVIVHCVGSGSVGFSQSKPLAAYNMTVKTTVDILEFMREKCPGAILVYPSSAAVYGNVIDNKGGIKETSYKEPVSIYGIHKKMVEDVITEYAKDYDIKAIVIRFFSLYGPGLCKQLLWDVCQKSDKTDIGLEFWGTGNETRDFLFVEDAVKLIDICVKKRDANICLVNGGTGKAMLVRSIIRKLLDIKDSNIKFRFNNVPIIGYPLHLVADVTKIEAMGFSPVTSIEDGFSQYVDWYKKYVKN